MRTVQVTTPTGNTITVLARMHIYDIIRMYPDEFPGDGHPFIVCTVNNELTSLSEKVGVNCTLVPYSVATTDGAECYRRSLIFALGKVWSELFPQDSLQISHSQGHSYYLYVDNSSKNLQMEDIKTTDICAHGPKEDTNHDVCITSASSMFFSNDKHITEEIVTNLRQELNLLIKANRPISSNIPMNANDLEAALESISDYNSVALLKSLNEVRVMTVRCDDYVQIYHTPLAPVTGLLKYYDLHTYKDGFVISFPSKRSPTELIPFKPNELLHDVYSEYTQWIRVLKVRTIGHLNNLCYKGMIKSFIQICETMQNKKLAELCDVITNNREYLQQYQRATRAANYTLGMSLRLDGDSGMNSRNIKLDSKVALQELVDAKVSTSTSDSEVEPNMLSSAEVSNCYAPVSNIEDKEIKVVFISGPSSSGKTTFAKKLAYNLKVMGREPLIISLDNYFVDREKTPLAEDGSYDFEHVNALDLDLFNDHLEALISGRKILSPIFDFKTGTRKQSTIEMIMPFRGIIIIEGIHALNPLLSRRIPLPNKILVFIAPFTAINMDDRMRISSRDCRLIRRIVRDNNFRGFTAEKTIELLKNLRVGEDRWIYPHQHRADIMFNTALDYELCVLNTHAYPLLCEIKPDSSAYKEARQLIALLEKVASINSEFVPKFSLLREFIGGSGSLEALRTDIEAISQSHPEEYEELASMVDQLSGMVSAGTATSREAESIVSTLYHALHHIKTYASVDAALSAAKVRANALAEETGALSAIPSTFPPWGKPTIYDPQNPITHITAVIVDQPHTMMDRNHPYTQYRMIFKSELPTNKRYYMVYRRFNDVKRLAATLLDLKVGPLPSLPPQRSVFQSLYDPLFIEDRRKRLAEYLQLLSSMLRVVQTDAFQHFLTEHGQYRAIEEGYT